MTRWVSMSVWRNSSSMRMPYTVPDAPEMPMISRRGELFVILGYLDGAGCAGQQRREQDTHGRGSECTRQHLLVGPHIGARRSVNRRGVLRRQSFRKRKHRFLLQSFGFQFDHLDLGTKQ